MEICCIAAVCSKRVFDVVSKYCIVFLQLAYYPGGFQKFDLMIVTVRFLIFNNKQHVCLSLIFTISYDSLMFTITYLAS